MVQPTLFVGLGTTGLNILRMLRQFMFEEYATGGLPIFRYIAIETDEKAVDLQQGESYEKIDIVHATIGNTHPIRNKLDRTSPDYNPYLDDWLDDRLLSEITSYREGARNIRRSGRLCLWENWRNMRDATVRAYNNMVAPESQRQTGRILTQYYNTKGLESPTQLVNLERTNIYVVGSLCGGSCSGMLIDVAYFLRNFLGNPRTTQICGMFTMFDTNLAAEQNKDNATRAANCYASLWELNYYSHHNTTYRITTPNGESLRDPEQKPFNYTLVVSPSGKRPNIRFTKQGINFDEEGLNLMVALNLFAEAAGDTADTKGAIRTDWAGFPGYGELRRVPQGEIPVMVGNMASFGLTAVWYPKYRIANAAACLVSKNLCENWLKAHKSRAEIVAEVETTQNDLVLGNLSVLSRPAVAGKPALDQEIENLLNRASQVFNQATSADKLESAIRAFPGRTDGNFKARFAQSGIYFKWLEENVAACKTAFLDEIDRCLNNQLAKIDFDSTYGLADVRAFFSELASAISKTIDQYPASLPSLDVNQLDFAPMRHAEKNFWTKVTGNREESVKEYQEWLIGEYQQLIIGDRGIFRKLRGYFLRQVLEAVVAKLGFEVHTDEPTESTIQQELDEIQKRLDSCIETFETTYRHEIQPPESECVRIVTNNPENKISTDAEDLNRKVIRNVSSAGLFNQGDLMNGMVSFLKKGHEEIRLHMSETYRRAALRELDRSAGERAQVVAKARELLEAGGDEIETLAIRSNPYQSFADTYQPLRLGVGPKIIFGYDTGDHLEFLQRHLDFDRRGSSPIDHLLFFYEEEACFALDDLQAYEVLKRHFDNSQAPYGHSTHKDVNFYNLEIPYRSERLERWCRALIDLVPEIQSVDSEVFSRVFTQNRNGDVFFQYQIDGLNRTLSLSNDNRIREICRTENIESYNRFFESVGAALNRFGREEIEKIVNEKLLPRVEDLEERNALARFYGDFLDEVYPNFERQERGNAESGHQTQQNAYRNSESQASEDAGSEYKSEGAGESKNHGRL